MSEKRLIRSLPQGFPNDEAAFQELLHELNFLPLQESTLINTHELRSQGAQLIIVRKYKHERTLMAIRWSKEGPVLVVPQGDGTEIVYLLPHQEYLPAELEDIQPLHGKEAKDKLPPISFCAWNDCVLVETDGNTYEYIIAGAEYKNKLPLDLSRLNSAARGDVKKTLEEAGPTLKMIAFQRGTIGNPADANTPNPLAKVANEPSLYRVLNQAEAIGTLSARCTAAGPAPLPEEELIDILRSIDT